jgi:CheY-like chemotaxis protein
MSMFAAGAKPLVLIVDDDHGSLELAQQLLAAEGLVPLVAASVVEGLALVATHRPALILLDVLMPERDGWEMLEMLKKDTHATACPVVMLTVDDDRQRSQAMGAAGHIVKPLTRAALHEALHQAKLFPPFQHAAAA